MIALTAMALLGAGVAALTRTSRRFGVVEFAGLSVVLGFCATGLLAVLLMLAGLRTGAWLSAVVALLGVAALVARRPSFAFDPVDRVALAAHAVTLLSAATILVGALHTDFGGFDAESTWMYKARSLDRHGTFRNPEFTVPPSHPHPHYPLLVPSNFALIGRPLRLAMATFLLASFAVVYALLRERLTTRLAAWFTAAYAIIPAFVRGYGGGIDPYCDYPLAVAVLVAAGAAVRWLETRDVRDGVLCGFALAALSQIKLEGAAIALIVAILLPILARTPRALAIVAPAALLVVVWRATSSAFPGVYSLAAPDWSRLPEILRGLTSVLFRLGEWGLAWPFIIVVLAWKRPWREFPVWLGAAMFAAYVCVLLTLPFGEDAKEVIRHNRVRLVMHFTPLLFVCAARAIARSASPAA